MKYRGSAVFSFLLIVALSVLPRMVTHSRPFPAGSYAAAALAASENGLYVGYALSEGR